MKEKQRSKQTKQNQPTKQTNNASQSIKVMATGLEHKCYFLKC